APWPRAWVPGCRPPRWAGSCSPSSPTEMRRRIRRGRRQRAPRRRRAARARRDGRGPRRAAHRIRMDCRGAARTPPPRRAGVHRAVLRQHPGQRRPGRPPYEQVGATLVTDVHAYEAIKLRLLNAGHQAVAYIGRLAGYELVDEAITDPRIAAWVRRYMEREGVPTLTPPEGFDLPGYIDELFARFGNANVADTLARL